MLVLNIAWKYYVWTSYAYNLLKRSFDLLLGSEQITTTVGVISLSAAPKELE